MSEDISHRIAKWYRNAIAITLLILLFSALIPFFNTIKGINISEGGTIVSAIIAALALTIASAIFLPEIRLSSIAQQHKDSALREVESKISTHRNEIKNILSDQQTKIDDLIKNNKDTIDNLNRENKETIDKLTKRASDDITRLDAHLSRVTGISVATEDPIWGIGWLLRSALRYARLPINERKLYSDLIAMIHKSIKRCNDSIIAMGEIESGNGFDKLSHAIEKIIIKDSTFFRDNDEQGVIQKRRKAVRLVKDFFDLSLFYKHTINIDRGSISDLGMDGIRSILIESTPISYMLAIISMNNNSADTLAIELSNISYAKEWGEDPQNIYNTTVLPAIRRVNEKKSRLVSNMIDDKERANFGVDYLLISD